MTTEAVVGLLAEPVRLRVFSAVTLGATTLPEVVETAGASPKEAAVALRRLTDGGLVEQTSDGLRSRYEEFKKIARTVRPERSSEEYGSGDERTEVLLRTFVRDGRLVRLPAQFRRREVLLRYFVRRSFDPGVIYPEKTVNDKLREWCDGGETDHVTIRRYLIDLCLLGREDNQYWLREDVMPTE
ncbi:DUF2087 domain-containing protein [Streptomyces sp. NPDC093250]|uniref:DUF2087 domain-containing protein n=1 Tax=Streptomyces sp. NPDC093250 TaxID=3366036 RepID=UPI0038143025